MSSQAETTRTTTPTFWGSVWEALRGSHQDYTAGSLNRAIFLLAIPMVLEMVLESLFAVVDVFWVGRLGANAVTTVGLTESMLALVFAVGMGLSLSTTAMVARRIGEKDPEDAAISGVQAIVLGLAVSLAMGIPLGILRTASSARDGSVAAVVRFGSGYARIALGGCRRDHHALSEQRDLSGSGRCGDRDAAAVGVEHPQPDFRPVFDLRPGTVSAARRDGRCAGDLLRAQHRRALPVLPAAARNGAHSCAGAASAVESRSAVAAAAGVADGNSAIHDCECELDRAGANYLALRSGGGRGLHGRHSHRDLLHSAVVGAEQCRSDAGGAESWAQAARTARSKRCGAPASTT